MNVAKSALRREVAARVAALAPERRAAAERRLAIAFAVFLRRVCAPGDLVMGYCPLPDEPDVTPILESLLESGYRLCLPRVTPHGGMEAREVSAMGGGDGEAGLVAGAWGLREPGPGAPLADPLAIRLVLVPGRAFTAGGARLGRGKGFYDRFLARTPARRVALAFRCQVFPEGELPVEGHDIRMHEVFSA